MEIIILVVLTSFQHWGILQQVSKQDVHANYLANLEALTSVVSNPLFFTFTQKKKILLFLSFGAFII